MNNNNNSNNATTTRRRPRDNHNQNVGGGIEVNYHDVNDDVEATPSEFCGEEGDTMSTAYSRPPGAKDRRGWTRRMLGVLNNQAQKGAYKVLPPVADEETYEDTFNDQSWKWTFGTNEDDGVWMNKTDRAGTIMAAMVWVLILYSIVTMALLAQQGHLPVYVACMYATVATLALASHAKTTFTDPGAVASSAVPLITKNVKFHAMCSICQSYKPKHSHHCRICNRCITRMDHHCPWMNNCIGGSNLKHFTLFLSYTWLGSGMAMAIFMVNYFFCDNENCEFNVLEIQLVRAMSFICLVSWMFTSSMLMSVIYGILTGVGTIDRLKKKTMNTWHLSDEEPIPWADVFGSGPFCTWILPTDPFFPDYDRLMGYATTQRLLREQSMEVRKRREAISRNHRSEI
eukprot:CAMPEP_0198150588 /NCGR_PEP_ID=MMETSP1443-20131203/51573_1 /TAXON_ID=186043 /ORGANISM="Entomoneis sp., Strain CCMP2396" /LENGTH=399 /DNA_ID=CAMNT_0043815943 /DNA_START=174 /DNA_END=1373 /DNA_ORIENTATION=-